MIDNRFLPCPDCGHRPKTTCLSMGEQCEDEIACPSRCFVVTTYTAHLVPAEWWLLDDENRRTMEFMRGFLR